MYQRFWLLLAISVAVALSALLPAQAAPPTLAYGGLQSCYPTGRTIPPFTLTATVATSDEYRMTHTVDQNGVPGVPDAVYEGPIASGTPYSVTITGGSATVPGSYTLTGSLYLVSSGVLVAQVKATVLIADPCPTPTPAPNPGNPESDQALADVVWSQAAMPARGAASGTILTITVRAQNLGRGTGPSDATLSYDPQLLRLLDARPQRVGDWVRARDDDRGTLVIALGDVRPRERVELPVRFLVLRTAVTTSLRLVRDDGLDRGNPLFLALGQRLDGPLILQAGSTEGRLKLSGRGFKPGEALAVWSNRSDGTTAAIGGFRALDDSDGTIALDLSIPAQDVRSLVVHGQISGVTGVLELPAGNAKHRSARARGLPAR